jgi:hypothetical protein
MDVPEAKMEAEPRLSVRVKVRPKAQLTLPEEIRGYASHPRRPGVVLHA